MPDGKLSIRAGGERDVPTILRLFDEAIAWLVERGQTGQWGERPFSERPENIGHAETWAAGGGLRVAELAGEPVGFVALGSAYPWVTPPEEPELYLQALVTSRAHAGRDAGGALVRHAYREARERGIGLVRVDCWAGAPRLVRWYEEQGFTKTETFTVGFGPGGDWTGQVFEHRIAWRIRPERPEDAAAVRELTRAAFGREFEARIPELVRATERYVPELSLVAEEGGELVGHILFSRFEVGPTRVLGIGPLSVAPTHQRRGIGSALVREALARADARGEALVVLEGNPAYYGRFGFRPAAELGIEPPEGVPAHYVQARPLEAYDPSLRGRVAYPEPFNQPP